MNFYYADGKIYSMEYDEELGIYHEFHMVPKATGAITFAEQVTGVKNKPRNRMICSKEELIAMLGNDLDVAPEEPKI